MFKGGTCLKKCYFETYRFSEDLDFTLQDVEHLDKAFLAEVFDEFWQELPAVFDWMNERTAAPALAAVPASGFGRMHMDDTWRVPAMVQAWGAEAGSLATIRFAAANHLCVMLGYVKESGERTAPTIEPYSVRRARSRDLLLFGVKADTGEARSYRLDRIRSATVTRQSFRPRYAIELTASGPLLAPAGSKP